MPNCTTSEMIEALDGHLSLIHSTFADDDDIMETGDSVRQWKDSLTAQVGQINFICEMLPCQGCQDVVTRKEPKFYNG